VCYTCMLSWHHFFLASIDVEFLFSCPASGKISVEWNNKQKEGPKVG